MRVPERDRRITKTLIACLAAAVLGGGGDAANKTPAAAKHAPPSGCLPAVSAAFAADTGATTVASRPTPADLGLVGCHNVAGGAAATVTVDSNPQAALRFNNTVEERDQVSLWSHNPQDSPRALTGIGQGADWIPSERLILSTDGKRLVSVQIRSRPHAQRTARALTLATLRALAAGAS